jgi:hypothetical protein
MQNIEKTIQSILKKFEEPDDYEKRKIVFWYDKDPTVDTEEELEEIRIALAENEKHIKLHVLNNNFFETKKLLEHDDKGSNYLIYSPQAERENESNWLLDIQLNPTGCSTYNSIHQDSRTARYQILKAKLALKDMISIDSWKNMSSFLQRINEFQISRNYTIPIGRKINSYWGCSQYSQNLQQSIKERLSGTCSLFHSMKKITPSGVILKDSDLWKDSGQW